MKIIKIYFFIAMLISFLFVYINEESAKIILKKNNYNQIGDIKFLDKNGRCYNYVKRTIVCPDNDKMVKII
jgi:hypothetical protein